MFGSLSTSVRIAPLRQVACWICSPEVMVIVAMSMCLFVTRFSGDCVVASVPPDMVWLTAADPAEPDADACEGAEAEADEQSIEACASHRRVIE